MFGAKGRQVAKVAVGWDDDAALAWNRLHDHPGDGGVVDVVSTFTEFTIVIEDRQVDLAFATLRALAR